MFPKLNIDKVIKENKEDEKIITPGGISYLYDFKKGDFITNNGKLIEVDGVDAITIWIEKLLMTTINKYEIYKRNDNKRPYGTSIKKLVLGKKLPRFFIESEVKRDIEEALTKHPQIMGIDNFNYDHKDTKLIIRFKVILSSNYAEGFLFERVINL